MDDNWREGYRQAVKRVNDIMGEFGDDPRACIGIMGEQFGQVSEPKTCQACLLTTEVPRWRGRAEEAEAKLNAIAKAGTRLDQTLSIHNTWTLSAIQSAAVVLALMVFCISVPIFVALKTKHDRAIAAETALAAEGIQGIAQVLSTGSCSELAEAYQRFMVEMAPRGKR
jgi:hypothetical protein